MRARSTAQNCALSSSCVARAAEPSLNVPPRMLGGRPTAGSLLGSSYEALVVLSDHFCSLRRTIKQEPRACPTGTDRLRGRYVRSRAAHLAAGVCGAGFGHGFSDRVASADGRVRLGDSGGQGLATRDCRVGRCRASRRGVRPGSTCTGSNQGNCPARAFTARRLLVVPSVTRENIESAISTIADGGFFDQG